MLLLHITLKSAARFLRSADFALYVPGMGMILWDVSLLYIFQEGDKVVNFKKYYPKARVEGWPNIRRQPECKPAS